MSGPSSYTAGGFTVTFSRLKRVLAAIVQGAGGYKAEVAEISGNSVKVQVKYYDYDAAADGTAIEVPDGTDLSGVNFILFVVGE